MAKQIDYPRASLKNCLDLAKAVEDLGGSCSTEMAADKLNKKVSGAFTALIASAVRFNLLDGKKGQLETSELYREYKHSYTDGEAKGFLLQAFLSPPLFQKIFDRFEGKELPVSHFEKLLIREFSVPEAISSRVSKYFLDGAHECEIIGSGNIIHKPNKPHQEADTNPAKDSEYEKSDQNSVEEEKSDNAQRESNKTDSYSVRITGPGMDSTIEINETEDLLIVQAMLKKVKKRIAQSDEDHIVWGDDDDD